MTRWLLVVILFGVVWGWSDNLQRRRPSSGGLHGTSQPPGTRWYQARQMPCIKRFVVRLLICTKFADSCSYTNVTKQVLNPEQREIKSMAVEWKGMKTYWINPRSLYLVEICKTNKETEQKQKQNKNLLNIKAWLAMQQAQLCWTQHNK